MLLFVCLFLGCKANAENKTKFVPQPFKTIRYEEDYSYLKNQTSRYGFWDGIKYIDIRFMPDAYLSLGGELRERYQNLHHYEFGLAEFKDDDYLLHRVLLHADLHLGKHFRTFVQFGSHYVFGKANDKTQVEENHLDLQQGFAELQIPVGDNTLMVRGGRQEMSFGSERLVSIRNNPNIRRSFDTVMIALNNENVTLDAFYAVPLVLRQGVFDDKPDDEQSFWGVYAALNSPPFPYAPKVDIYYLGLDKANAAYTQGIANEHRHTLGTRIWRKLESWDYNFEFAYQFGIFGQDNISAWTAASDTGYRWESVALKPRLALKIDVVSGDDNPNDHTLKTFNPLFPKLAYFSENALVVPANLFNVYPYLNLELMEDVEFGIGWDFLWRYSTQDAFYVNPFRPLPGTEQSKKRYVGSELTLDMSWQVNRNIQLNTAYVHLFTGGVLNSVGAKDVDFFMLTGSYRF
jgi:hypothetical protein